MKKMYTALAIFFIFNIAEAQVRQGQVLLNGAMAFESERSESEGQQYRLTQLSFTPSAGIFLFDMLATGVRVSVSNRGTKTFDPSTFNLKVRTTSFSPFMRFYVLKPSRPYNLFADLSLDYYNEVQRNANFKTMHYGRGYTVSGGPVIFLTPNIATELTFSYSNWSINSTERTKFSTGIGFQYHFFKKN